MYETERCIEALKEFGFPVFGMDVQKDEIKNNPSFFIFNDDGELTRGESSSVFNKSAYAAFVTVDNTEVPPIFSVIIALDKCGLRFDRTEQDTGKIANTEVTAKMTTFVFHQSLRVCIDG